MTGTPLDVAAVHDDLRPLMFSIAYRMLGSVTEAEDVVQDAFLRLHQAERDGAVIDSPDAYATTVTTRLAIDALRSARHRREHYVGPWLPEPLLAGGVQVAHGTRSGTDPAQALLEKETVSFALLTVMEELTPIERAVFVLREAIGYPYPQIAEVLGKSEANCRQLFSRARRRLDAAVPAAASPPVHDEVITALTEALRTADLARLEQLLATDVVLHADGGGRAPAITAPMAGGTQVGRFLLSLWRLAQQTQMDLDLVGVNGRAALRARTADGALLALMSMDVSGGRIVAIRNQLNPEKLAHLGPVGDLTALIAGRTRPSPSA